MGRPSKEERSKKDTKTALDKALRDRGLTQKYYQDQVSEYMVFYDNLADINAKLSEGFDIDLLREKRQITKEMRSILTFLELKPAAGNGGESDVEL